MEGAAVSGGIGAGNSRQRHPVVEKWSRAYSNGMEIGGCPLTDFASRILQAHLKGGMRVLDAGCGTGRTMRHLRSMGFLYQRDMPEVTGVDVCMEALLRCRGLQIICSDMFLLPFSPGSFDVIIARQVLDGYSRREIRLLSLSFSEVLKEGGILIIEERGPLDSRARHSLHAAETDNMAACRFLPRTELGELFTLFSVVDWEECLRRRSTPAGNVLVSHEVSLMLRKSSSSCKINASCR
jgi:SAM-dependent methyltransferase